MNKQSKENWSMKYIWRKCKDCGYQNYIDLLFKEPWEHQMSYIELKNDGVLDFRCRRCGYDNKEK